jgi:hypothetical protein
VNQPSLFSESELEQAWRDFHAEHPDVFAMFERFTLEALAGLGTKRLGARMVWERMRWDTTVATNLAGAAWKLNDHHVPFYARLFMERHPLRGRVFETRRRALEHRT